MKCLVTGAAGFIGSHLCERLINDGHTVFGIDSLETGVESNLESLRKQPDFVFTPMPVKESAWLIQYAAFDWVFHLAARADIVPSIREPYNYLENNVLQTGVLLEAARVGGVKKVVYAASSSCYGIPDYDQYPTPENAEIKCEYPYALTKYMGEELVMHWSKIYKIPAISLRLFNVYGPRHRTSGDYGAMFGVFMSQLANDKPITVVGDGTQTRDFTYISDVCEAFVLAANSDQSGQIFNIGSGGTYSVNEIADFLGAKDRVYIPKRPGEPGITYASIHKAQAVLGYQPQVTIRAGCEIMKGLVPSFKDAPLWTPETIAETTGDWFKYLGG